MNLSSEHLKMVLSLIRKTLPGAQVFAYGSRVRKTSKPSSDLDILIQNAAPISKLQLSTIKEALSLSNLPFFVDLQDYSQVNADFLSEIEKDLTHL